MIPGRRTSATARLDSTPLPFSSQEQFREVAQVLKLLNRARLSLRFGPGGRSDGG